MKANDIAELVQIAYTALKRLTDEDALAGVIITDSAYLKVRKLFSDKAEEFRPSGLSIDRNMEQGFVVDGLVILRGTKPEGRLDS